MTMDDDAFINDLAPVLRKFTAQSAASYSLVALQGDASSRRYYRLTFDSPEPSLPTSLIIMRLPLDAFGSDEGGIAQKTNTLPFVAVHSLLAEHGVRVPFVHVADVPRGILLLEDLGDTTFELHLRKTPPEQWPDAYRDAVQLLATMHDRCSDLPDNSLVKKRAFDRQLFRWELDHFSEWGLQALGATLSPTDTRSLESAFENLSAELASLPQGFVHRDYQSKNLMRLSDGSLAVIDFQDALIGPRVYDLVALLCDSYVDLPLELQESMIAQYTQTRSLNTEDLSKEFWLVALQRKLKDAGRFIYIDRVRRNPRFVQWYPQSLVYVGRALCCVEGYSNLSEALKRSIPGFPNAIPTPHAQSPE